MIVMSKCSDSNMFQHYYPITIRALIVTRRRRQREREEEREGEIKGERDIARERERE
jgi:hypothetical protein